MKICVFILQQSGTIIFGIREAWVNILNIEEKVAQLQNTGIWRLIAKREKPNYRENVSGLFYIMEKL